MCVQIYIYIFGQVAYICYIFVYVIYLHGSRRVFLSSGLGIPYQNNVTFTHRRSENPSVGECSESAPVGT